MKNKPFRHWHNSRKRLAIIKIIVAVKIVNKYLIRKFIGPFVLTFLFALVILLMQFLWLYVDELVGKGLEIYLILKLLFYASATFVVTAVPLAVLLSSLMTFGSLGEHYEIVALKAAGIPISRLMLPLAILAVLIGGFTFLFNDMMSPRAYVKMRTLLSSIKEQKPTLSIEEGVFYDGFDNYVIRVGKKHRDNETIEDILIYDHSKRQGNTTMTYARQGSMKITPDGNYLLFNLYDGFFWDESQSQNSQGSQMPLTRGKFKEQYKRFDLSSFQMQEGDSEFFSSSTKALSLNKLSSEIDTIKSNISKISENAVNSFFNNLRFFSYYDDTLVKISNMSNYFLTQPGNRQEQIFNQAKQMSENMMNSVKYTYEEIGYRNRTLWSYEIEWHRKFTLSAACLLFFFIGAPLGSIIRKGGIGIPLLITILFFTLYFAISIFGEKLAKGSVFAVGLGMWLSSLILIPICFFLTKKATVDSSVFSLEEYGKKFKKIKKIFAKKDENPANMS